MSREDTIEQVIREFFSLLPEDMRRFRADAERNLRATLQAAFRRVDLVTREEFDLQCALLSRTRAMLDELEARLKQLESELDRGNRN